MMTSVHTSSSPPPLVSVLLATYNEARYIEGTVASILRQDTPDFDLELLVMDGRSNDGTAGIVAAIAERDPRVRLLVNEKRSAPFAFNLGLQAARGEYVCIFGAHTRYREDYISTCWRELISRQAVACGGRVLTAPANQSRQARLVAWALAHPFGSSRKSFRTQQEGYVDIVNYPVVLKQAVLDAGGYDESLIRNEDNDMFQKLRARGHKLYCTWQTSCSYHPAPDVPSLVRYAFRNGFWNALSLRKNPSSMSPRYFAPALFVVTLLLLVVIALLNLVSPGPTPLLALLAAVLVLAIYAASALVASCVVAARDRSPAALLLPLVFFSFHCSYGAGTLYALLTGAKPPAS